MAIPQSESPDSSTSHGPRECRPSASDATQAPKRRKLNHPSRSFWETLSHIHLTRNALKALDDSQGAFVSGPAPRRILEPVHHCQPAEQFLRQCSPQSLRQVKRLALHGGPDTRELLEASSLARRKQGLKSASDSKNNTNLTATQNTGQYDRNFEQMLVDNRVYFDKHTYTNGEVPPVPDNLDEIHEALMRPRPPPSSSQFSGNAFKAFRKADTFAFKKSQVVTTVLPIIAGEEVDAKCVAGQIPFNNLVDLTDHALAPACPDVYCGASPDQLHYSIRRPIDGYIIPSTQENLPLVPNFFVEVKGPDGSAAVARRQLCYDLALGARGMRAIQGYGASTADFDNRAYTLGFTYQDGQLKLYTTHPIQPPSPREKSGYLMTQINSWVMTGSSEMFRQGIAAYQNGMDWATKQRDAAIKQAKEQATQLPAGDGLESIFVSETSACHMRASSQQAMANHGCHLLSHDESEISAGRISLDGPPVEHTKL